MLGLSVLLISVLLIVTIISVIPFAIVDTNGGTPTPPPPPPPDPIVVLPTTPTLQPIPSPDSDGSIYLGWNTITGAISYQMYMSKDGASWQLIKTTGAIAFVHHGLTNGNYRFKVRAYNSAGYSAYSNIRSVIVSISEPDPVPDPIPDAPTLQSIPSPDTDGIIYLSWNSITGAVSYQVYMSKDGGSWESVVTTLTSYTYSDLTDGTYEFKVRSYNSVDYSVDSNVESVVVSIPTVPIEPVLEIISSDPSITGLIRLEWNVIDEADRYVIHRSENEGAFSPLIEVFIQIYYDDVIEIDGTYTYKVKAGNDNGYSDFSNEESVVVQLLVLIPPESPTMNNLTYSTIDEDVIVQLSWSEVDCDNYNVYRSIDFGSYVLIGENVFSTGYSDTLTDVGVYFYRVSAINVDGESELSNPTTIGIQEEGEPIVDLDTDEEPPITPTNYTMLYVLIALGILAVPVVILVKKRKR